MANVLFLTLVFPPDSVSTAQIMGELAADLQSEGHKVTVLTTVPHFNRDLEAESRQPIRNHWGPVLRRSDYHGIPVYHTFMPRKGKSILLRLIGWVGFHFVSTVAGITVIPRPDVIVTPSPPLTNGVFAWMLGKFHKAPYIYNVQEIYPDIAVRLGALRNRRLIHWLETLERFVYRKGEKITVIAPRMRQMLMKKGVPFDKVEVMPNFVDIEDLTPLPKENDFSRRHGIDKKFVVSYAGNLGPAQGLENFVDAAALLRNEGGIHFVMMGDGSLRESLRERVVNSGLKNFTFLPYQPYSMMPQIYAASEICLVPQAAETGSNAVPSKVYRIMACARPVLASTESDSDLATLVRNAGCGAIVPPDSSSALSGVIDEAYRDPVRWEKMGQAGRSYVVENYSRHSITMRYNNLIRSIANG